MADPIFEQLRDAIEGGLADVVADGGMSRATYEELVVPLNKLIFNFIEQQGVPMTVPYGALLQNTHAALVGALNALAQVADGTIVRSNVKEVLKTLQ